MALFILSPRLHWISTFLVLCLQINLFLKKLTIDSHTLLGAGAVENMSVPSRS